jgi:hypothetical protein
MSKGQVRETVTKPCWHAVNERAILGQLQSTKRSLLTGTSQTLRQDDQVEFTQRMTDTASKRLPAFFQNNEILKTVECPDPMLVSPHPLPRELCV